MVHLPVSVRIKRGWIEIICQESSNFLTLINISCDWYLTVFYSRSNLSNFFNVHQGLANGTQNIMGLKILARSWNLGNVSTESRRLICFLFGSEIAWVLGSDFQTRVSTSWRVSDLTIRYPLYSPKHLTTTPLAAAQIHYLYMQVPPPPPLPPNQAMCQVSTHIKGVLLWITVQ